MVHRRLRDMPSLRVCWSKGLTQVKNDHGTYTSLPLAALLVWRLASGWRS